MNRAHDFSNLIQLYQDKIQQKQHQVTLPTHVTTLSRDFIINQDGSIFWQKYSAGIKSK